MLGWVGIRHRLPPSHRSSPASPHLHPCIAVGSVALNVRVRVIRFDGGMEGRVRETRISARVGRALPYSALHASVTKSNARPMKAMHVPLSLLYLHQTHSIISSALVWVHYIIPPCFWLYYIIPPCFWLPLLLLLLPCFSFFLDFHSSKNPLSPHLMGQYGRVIIVSVRTRVKALNANSRNSFLWIFMKNQMLEHRYKGKKTIKQQKNL